MKTRKAKAASRKPEGKAHKPKVREKVAAAERATALAEAVAKLPAKIRRQLLRESLERTAKLAPSMAAAKSDLLRLLLAVGAEFISRYFPDATNATFFVTKYDAEQIGPPVYSTQIPMACPAAEGGAS